MPVYASRSPTSSSFHNSSFIIPKVSDTVINIYGGNNVIILHSSDAPCMNPDTPYINKVEIHSSSPIRVHAEKKKKCAKKYLKINGKAF